MMRRVLQQLARAATAPHMATSTRPPSANSSHHHTRRPSPPQQHQTAAAGLEALQDRVGQVRGPREGGLSVCVRGASEAWLLRHDHDGGACLAWLGVQALRAVWASEQQQAEEEDEEEGEAFLQSFVRHASASTPSTTARPTAPPRPTAPRPSATTASAAPQQEDDEGGQQKELSVASLQAEVGE